MNDACNHHAFSPSKDLRSDLVVASSINAMMMMTQPPQLPRFVLVALFAASLLDVSSGWLCSSTRVPISPASVAFDTLQSGVNQEADVIIIDTAGRLHNKVNLMNELSKVKRVMQKVVGDAPHDVLLVLDGSTGQNAFEQAKQFTAATEVTSLAVTKLDGTAKGGVVIGISDQFKIPVKYIGVGEGIEDLQVFNKYEFVDSFFK